MNEITEFENWDEWWEKRSGKKVVPIIGKLLFFIRERMLAKIFVNIAIQHINSGFLLEAGCGSALSSILVKKKRKKVKVIGLDFSSGALKIAREMSDKKDVKIFLVKADIHKLPFKNKSVNLVWNIGTIEHFKNLKPVLKEMKRVSKITIGLVPKKSFFWITFPWILKILKFEEDEEYFKLYTRKEYENQFKKCFKNPKVKTVSLLKFIPYLAGISK